MIIYAVVFFSNQVFPVEKVLIKLCVACGDFISHMMSRKNTLTIFKGGFCGKFEPYH